MNDDSSKLLSTSKDVVLALQHLMAMFGATVLVPMITGLDPSIALFTAGIGTLIFHLCTGGKVPVFLGSSFAFIAAIVAVRDSHGGDLAFAQGGILIAGLIYVLVSFLIKKIGSEKLEKFLPPQVVGPMIIVIGLSLIPTAVDMASEHFLIAALTLAIALIINFMGKGFFKQLSILVAIIVGYIVAWRVGLVDMAPVIESKLISMPNFTLPKFSISAILVIAPVVLAVFMEHVGDITTNGQVVGKNFIEDPGLHKTLLGDGLATMFAAMVGGPANTTYGENTGVLAITKNYNPAILRLAAIFAVLLGFISKIGAFLGTIPSSVMGGISIMLFGMIALIGVQTLQNSKVKFDMRNVIVMATIIILGLGTGLLESIFDIKIGIPISETDAISGLSLAAIVGIVLNLILNSNRSKA
ncbi:MAG: uracil-xanthine permease [Clostridiales bacterium]|nr:uracil-xanthine permease [Clostridiales bacterium]